MDWDTFVWAALVAFVCASVLFALALEKKK